MSKGTEAFYLIPREHRWLSTPYEVGGWNLEVQQVGHSLAHAVKECFEMNEVPHAIQADLALAQEHLTNASYVLDEIVYAVSQCILTRLAEDTLVLPDAIPASQITVVAGEFIKPGDLLTLDAKTGTIYKVRRDGKKIDDPTPPPFIEEPTVSKEDISKSNLTKVVEKWKTNK